MQLAVEFKDMWTKIREARMGPWAIPTFKQQDDKENSKRLEGGTRLEQKEKS